MNGHHTILDFIHGEVIKDTDPRFPARYAELMAQMAKQNMSATGAIPPPGWRPDAPSKGSGDAGS